MNCWDESIVKSINPKIRCFNLEYNLRDEFYTAPKWDFSKCVPFTIFTNPGGTPLKGLHQLIKAIAIVKLKYDNVQLVVPGMGDKTGNMLHNCGYAKYISNLIKELKLTNNITFKGRQNAMEMIENISKSNIVVIPSAIEGTSLVLREAMYIGGPSIASFRGGMADFINDKYDGFLYDYPEYPYLATRIIELFENRELCIKFSERAIEKAERAHDREKNINAYVETYNQIIK